MDPTDKQAAKYKSKNLMGYIQDKVDVGMTKLRSDEGVQLDVAILKATIQDAVVPKEKHVVTLKIGSSASAPRQQVNYVIHGLSKRLEEKSGWLVTLKTLIVFHRLLREVDPSFQEEIIKYQERTGAHRLLRLDGFADHTTKDTWDYSAWIRVYSVYLDERLGVFKSMRFDPELESGGQGHANATGGNQTGGEVRETKLKNCGAQELLERLPQIQRLLSRLISCIPEGAAQSNEIVLQSCVMVMRELKSTYRTVCEGIINLADKFFEMERSDALKALDAYKDNMVLNDKLNTFLSAINNVPALRGAVQMPALQSLPPDFLATMEEYVREAPKVLDPNSAARANVSAGPTGAPPATLRSSTLLRQSGTTSAAMTGTGAGGVIPAPVQGVLKIGPPTGAPPPVQPQPSVDLLGDDFSAPPAQPSPPAAAPQGYGQLPPQQPQQGYGQTGQLGEAAQFGAAAGTPGYNAAPPPLQTNAVGFGFGDQAAFGSPPGAPTPGAQPAPPAGFNPFGSPPNQAAPSPHPQPGYGSPAGANPFGSGAPPTNPYGAPTPTATNPFAPAFPPPAAGPTGATNPFGGAPAPAYASTPGYGAPAPSPYGQPAPNAGFGAPQPVPTNPFGGAGPAWGQGPPQGAAAWGTNVQPGSTALKKQPDPLATIGADLFGKSNQQPVQQSLRDMKQLHL